MNTKTISISIFRLVMPLFVLLFVQSAANAQNEYPNLFGAWTISENGTKTPKIVTIRHTFPISVIQTVYYRYYINGINGEDRQLTGEYGRDGIFIEAYKVRKNNELIEIPKMSGKVLQNGTLIRWSDNTVWEKTNLPTNRLAMLIRDESVTTLELKCFDAVQGNVAYDQEGNKSWTPDNIRKLCKGTTNPSATISCFQTQIKQHNDWNKGIAACQPGSNLLTPVQAKSTEDPLKKSAMSSEDMNLVMSWIAAQVSAQRLPFCYRQSFGRGAGEPASTCANGWEKIGLRCQPKCIAGYERSGTHCRAVCPQGFTDIGSYCQKPAAYGRGAGYAWKFGDKAFSLDAARERCTKDNPQGCEQNGAIFYPKCKIGFHNVGANICSPNCPYNWQDTGTGCYKPATPANLSGDPLGCKPGMEGKDGLCYNKCNKTDYSGVGPVCWQNCPSQMPVNCGAGCATTKNDCAMAITDMVISPIMAAISLATLGGASGVTVTGNTIKGGTTTAATKAPGIIAKMKAIYAKIDLEVKAIKLTNNAYKTSSAIVSERDLVLKEFSENFAEMTSYEINKTLEERLHPKQLEEVRLEWAKRHFYLMGQTNADVTLRNALTVASVVDPTGLLAVEKAFYHPVCKNSTPFPTITHNPFLN